MIRLRRFVPVLAAVLVLSPLLRAPSSDSYPLSTYPMFATDRGPVKQVATIVGLDEQGRLVRLSPHVIAGTEEVVLAWLTVERAVAAGESGPLCDAAAARIGPGIVELVVRTETVDLIDHILDDAPAIKVDIHARCQAKS